ncbi:MAG: DUF3313 domain-containing protein [Desulfarculus sp.]|nr:DUF3313 domain-containing protein [Desulfarculus sp.]
MNAKTLRLVLTSLAICLGAAWLLAGCAAPQVAPSGFLAHHPQLRPVPGMEGISYWEKPGVKWERYRRLLVEPVRVRLDEKQSTRQMSGEETSRLAAALRQAVIKASADRYPQASAPGPDVLLVRAALTHLKPVNPALNIATTAAVFMPVDVGQAAVEAEFLDAQSGEVLAEAAASRSGSPMELTTLWTRWSQVEACFAVWADMLRQAMEEPPPPAKR